MSTATPATAEPTPPPPDDTPQQGRGRRGSRGALRLLLSTLVVFLALYGVTGRGKWIVSLLGLARSAPIT